MIDSLNEGVQPLRWLISRCLCVQVELGSAEGKALTLHSQFGGQQAGVRLRMKCFPMTKEMRGTMWHSWSWLQDRGLPRNIEVTNTLFFVPYIILVYWTVFYKSWWKKQTPLLWFASPRAFVPSRESFLGFSPGLSSLWTDTNCSPLAWMSVWLMDVWPCCSPALHHLLIKQGHSPVWTLPWLLSSKVRLYQQLGLIFMCSSHLLLFGMSKYIVSQYLFKVKRIFVSSHYFRSVLIFKA